MEKSWIFFFEERVGSSYHYTTSLAHTFMHVLAIRARKLIRRKRWLDFLLELRHQICDWDEI